MRKKLTRREFVTSAVAASALAAGASAQSAKSAKDTRPPTKRPNVLYIMADDMGWGDLSCYGRPDYRTPNLDRLASEGTRFNHAYSAAPVCTPTRCAFVTGRYPARTPVGLEEPLAWRKQLVEQRRDVGLAPEHPTVASLLKAAGYRTALVGKWHLGYLPKYSPLKSGFGEFFGIMSGGADYFTHKDANGEADLFEAEVPVERVGYMTDLFERTLFWRNDVQGAARSGRWKYLKDGEKAERLFDLQTDEREQADSRAAQPQIFERLRAGYAAWESQMLKQRPPRPT